MKVMNIKDKAAFFDMLSESKGRVLVNLGNGASMDLKANLNEIETMAEAFAGKEIKEMDLSFTDGSDIRRVLNFLIAA